MVSIRSELRTILSEAIRRAQDAGTLPADDVPEILVEVPPERADAAFGDYASPIALSLAKIWKRTPVEIAEVIASQVGTHELIERVEVAAPGFLNIRLSDAWLSAKLDNILREGASLGRQDFGKGMSVNLEFVSANPTGFPHVGNGRTLFVGDVLGNVLAHTGHAVTREYYSNDVGRQVARFGESVLRRILQAEGHDVPYPAELYQGEDVKIIAAGVAEALREDRTHKFSPADLDNTALKTEIARCAVEQAAQAIRHTLEEVAGAKYDVWFSESQLYQSGEVDAVLEELAQKRCTETREGAVWLKASEYDAQDRVLVRSNGDRTYLAADIAYHRNKLRRGFQILVDFWGADHHGHIAPLVAGLRALGEDADRLQVLLVHMVRLVQGGESKKISKRLGTAVPLQELLAQIGVSAARFLLTLKPLSSPLDLDLDAAVAQKEENPVYYAQYAYVRLASILRKAKERNLVDEALVGSWQINPVTLTHDTEHRLMALGMRLPEVLEDIARTREVQRLPQYALDVARAVHRFYDTVPVLSVPESDLVRGRLILTLAMHSVLEKVFDLLGVEKPSVM